MKRPLGLALGLLLVGFAACTQNGGPLKVDSVEPPQGTTAGGEEISIVGSGFQPGKTQAQVKFGRKNRRNRDDCVAHQDSRRDAVEREGAGGRARVVRRRRRVQDPERLPLHGADADGDNARRAFFSGKKPAANSTGKIEVEKAAP